MLEKRPLRGSVPNFKTNALADWKLKGRENCENEHRETASFMYNVVQKTNATKQLWLRPAGSDPEVVCQKDSFLKVSVSLGGFGPSVAHGKHSVRRRCVQATKKQGRNLLSPWRHWAPFVRPLKGGYKNRRLGKSRGVRFDLRLVYNVRCDTLWAWNGCSVFLLALLNVSGNTHAVSLLHAS